MNSGYSWWSLEISKEEVQKKILREWRIWFRYGYWKAGVYFLSLLQFIKVQIIQLWNYLHIYKCRRIIRQFLGTSLHEQNLLTSWTKSASILSDTELSSTFELLAVAWIVNIFYMFHWILKFILHSLHCVQYLLSNQDSI